MILLLFLACLGDFYLKVGSGATIPQKTQIRADSYWDTALQGYDGEMGTRALYNVAVGYDFPCYFGVEAATYYRPGFHYSKYQTPFTTHPGNLGNKIRRFDLDILSGMVNFYLTGKGCEYLEWRFNGCALYPVLGAGIGGSEIVIHDFRATDIGTIDASCADSPHPDALTYGSENSYTQRFQLSYQLMAGFEMTFCNRFALFLGYRWFDPGQFKGPSYIRNTCGFALDATGHEWKINFKTHEAFLELKVYL